MRGSLASPIVTDLSAYASNFLLPNLPFDSVDWNCRTATDREPIASLLVFASYFQPACSVALRVDLAEEKFYGSRPRPLRLAGDFAAEG